MHPHVRSTDDQNGGLRVVREVPLWGLLTALFLGVAQAVAWWIQTQDNSKSNAELKAQNVQVITTLAEINKQLSATNLKDLEHDLKIGTLTNRVQALEALYPRSLPMPQPAPSLAR